MEKYKTDFKVKVVKSYLAGEGGSKLLARRYRVPAEKVLFWVNYYRLHGIAGLRPKNNVVYSPEFKLQVLAHQEREVLSNKQVAALYDIRNPNKIVLWRTAREEGKLRAVVLVELNKLSDDSLPSRLKQGGASEKELIQLREQNEKLQAQVAYLKKLQALIQAKRLAASTRR
jgi:transposase